jgi:NCS1 family nucleobase:cation symporter-1
VTSSPATAAPSTAVPTAVPPGDDRREVGLTLDEPPPRLLGFLDQAGLWGNLGVSLLGFTGAIFVLQPGGPGTAQMSLLAALTATVVGTLLGTLVLGLSTIPGARTGAPAMVLLRGLFGARLSYLPTALNILQCLGWGTFELVTIATAGQTVLPDVPHWLWVLFAGVVTTLLTLRPLGSIRVLRRYVTVAVLVVMAYLFVQLLRHPLPSATDGTWTGFWSATDTTVAVAVSFVPLASDYSRHSRSPGRAFAGSFLGYSVAQIACYALGLLALVTVAKSPDDIYGAFVAVPLGGLAFGILGLRELDQSFANVYSTAVSVQNIRPRWDRRVLSVVIGATVTVFALALNISNYQNFLYLLGSVFVPLSAVLLVDFFLGSGRSWDLGVEARARWLSLLPWAVGFVVYQLINPGYLAHWSTFWASLDSHLGFTPPAWMSASITSFVAAAVVALIIARWPARLGRRVAGGIVQPD